MPFTLAALYALQDGPQPLEALRAQFGSPPPTTLRGQIRVLTSSGAVEKQRHGGFPGGFDYHLSTPGTELIEVAKALSDWLQGVYGGPVSLTSGTGRRTTRVLIDAWRSGIPHALAASPRSLTELSGLIHDLSYPALERRVAAMRRARLLESTRREGPGPLRITKRLRLGVRPLAAAWRWESRWGWDAPAATAEELDTALLLALPLVELPISITGTCGLKVGDSPGLSVVIEQGAVTVRRKQAGAPEACGAGGIDAWIAAILDGHISALRLAGDELLASELLTGMHKKLRTK